MLDHLGEGAAAAAVQRGFEDVLARGGPDVLTPDLGGQGTTEALGRRIAEEISAVALADEGR